MKYPLLKTPKCFRIEMLSHETNLRPADEVFRSIEETLFKRAIAAGRKVRAYIRVEYEPEPTSLEKGRQ